MSCIDLINVLLINPDKNIQNLHRHKQNSIKRAAIHKQYS